MSLWIMLIFDIFLLLKFLQYKIFRLIIFARFCLLLRASSMFATDLASFIRNLKQVDSLSWPFNFCKCFQATISGQNMHSTLSSLVILVNKTHRLRVMTLLIEYLYFVNPLKKMQKYNFINLQILSFSKGCSSNPMCSASSLRGSASASGHQQDWNTVRRRGGDARCSQVPRGTWQILLTSCKTQVNNHCFNNL